MGVSEVRRASAKLKNKTISIDSTFSQTMANHPQLQ